MFLNNFFYYLLQLFYFLIITKCTSINKINQNNILKCGYKKTSANVVKYIVGGRQSYIENWPWQVNLSLASKISSKRYLILKVHLKIANDESETDVEYDYSNCGASILSDTWILTAAHCFSDRVNPKLYILHEKNVTWKNQYKEVKYESVIIHPEYEEHIGVNEYSTNDIALVKLSNRSKLKGSIPVCLPEENTILPVNAICHITGFGATTQDDKEVIKRLREGRVVIKPDTTCIRTLQLDFYDNKTMICAGKTKFNRANSCQGDSGGITERI